MKKISTIIISFLMLISTGCEDFLEKSPNGVISTGNYYQDEDDAKGAINSAYSILTGFWISNIAFEKDILSDDAVKGHGADLGALINHENLNLTAADALVVSLWGDYFKGIFRCNIVLDEVPGIEMDENLKDRILGEAHFLRAYYYYNLVIRYGGVPLVTSALDSEQYPTRSTLDQTWALIEADCLTAADKLPLKSAYADENVGRPAKGAANSLLGIANLFQEDWQEAYDAFDEVIGTGEYGLESNFADLFKPESDNGTEVVFETQAKGGEEFDYSNGFNFWVRPRNGSSIFGLGFCMPTQDLVDEFEEGDPRLRLTVIREDDIISEEIPDVPFDPVWAPETGMNCGKYVVDVPVGVLAERHEQNQKNIRYAEVLLGCAEAAYHLENNSDAVTKINLVRERARGGESNILPNVKESNDIFSAIIHERRVELALEGKRYFDLVRWNLAEQELGELGYQAARKGLWPLPQGELDVNKNLIQNPGY